MTLSFDMRRIGRTIGDLRRERNMTQMQLADEMGVSFQAISNWERGQSMPDISKLPELAELFDTTIDHLLGRKSAVVEAAAAGTLAEAEITPEDLAEAAPLLKPDQVDAAADRISDLPVDDVALSSLLPFLSEDKVDEIAHARMKRGQDISVLLPFMTEDAIDEIAIACLKRHQPIDGMLPFVSEKLLDRLADLLSGY